MDIKSPIEVLLMQANDILRYFHDHKGSIAENMTPKLLEDLDKLEQAFAQFKELNEKVFKESNIDVERLKAEAMRSPNYSQKDKKLFQRAKEIEREARNMQLSLSKAMERGKRENAGASKDPLKRKIKERRKLFKPLGGDKKWIPL